MSGFDTQILLKHEKERKARKMRKRRRGEGGGERDGLGKERRRIYRICSYSL